MNGNLTDVFTSKEYKLLCYLGSIQIPSMNNRIVDSQEDIAYGFKCCIATINRLMQTLELSGCIKKHKAKSGYNITPTGYHVIETIALINKVDGGKRDGSVKKGKPLADG